MAEATPEMPPLEKKMSRQPIEKATRRAEQAIHRFALALMFCAMAITVPVARAQILYGSITGTVTDPSGAVVPDTTVIVTNQATGDSRTTTTNSTGEYHVPALQPALYTIALSSKGGFGAFTEKDVTVSVNREVRIDVALRASTVQVETTVTDTLATLQTESAEVNH